MTDTPGADLIGCLIKATAPGKRVMRGVVLPPAAGARTPLPRIDGDVSRKPNGPIRFNPADWDITVLAGPDYNYDNLPAEQLATATMLRTEQRLKPGGDVLGTYRTRDGAAVLYAVADAVPMAPLSPTRAAAWTAARTCIRCGQTKRRPLPEYARAGGRLCDTCQRVVAGERWTEQARAAQADATIWARDVLTDSSVLLIASAGEWSKPRVRIETLGTDGRIDVIVDAKVRQVDDPGSIQYSPGWTAEKAEAWRNRNQGTMAPSEFRRIVDELHEARVLAWFSQDRSIHISHELPLVDPGDQVEDRLALWSGEAPAHTGHWYPEPRIPWTWYPQRFAPYTAHKQLREAGNLTAEISSLRTLLLIMAASPAPEPTTPAAKP